MLNESTKYDELKKWDIKIDPKFIKGNLQEKKISSIFADIINEDMEDIKIEVKSELQYSWLVSGNIYIEISQFRNGKWEPSGLSTTEAKTWVHVLNGTSQNQMKATLMFDVDELKVRLRYLYDMGFCGITSKLKTHDGNATKAVVVDPRLLLFTDDEVVQFRNKVEQEQNQRVKDISKKYSK
jgi:hypothetical protein